MKFTAVLSVGALALAVFADAAQQARLAHAARDEDKEKEIGNEGCRHHNFC